jgi:4-hydroxy-2-oxoheptanedioate aldolase
MVRHNRTKAKIKAGEVVSGVTVGVNDPNIVELAGLLGFDFAIIDCEHDLFNGRDLENIIRAANLHDVTPIVRMQNNPEFILHALNGGAQGEWHQVHKERSFTNPGFKNRESQTVYNCNQ